MWEAVWTGGWPCLCNGEWQLFKDDQKVKTAIPFQEKPADTEGRYSTWYFENWSEVFEDYEDGLSCTAWINEYESWLKTLAPKEEWEEIYEAFQKKDWRYYSCGGCI